MSRFEEKFLRRWTGLRIIIASIAFGLAGILPLLLYIGFGPPDGNPVGLGLLAVAAVPLAVMGVLVGLIKVLSQYSRQSKE